MSYNATIDSRGPPSTAPSWNVDNSSVFVYVSGDLMDSLHRAKRWFGQPYWIMWACPFVTVSTPARHGTLLWTALDDTDFP